LNLSRRLRVRDGEIDVRVLGGRCQKSSAAVASWAVNKEGESGQVFRNEKVRKSGLKSSSRGEVAGPSRGLPEQVLPTQPRRLTFQRAPRDPVR